MHKRAPAVLMLVLALLTGGTLADAWQRETRAELKPVWPEIVEGFDPVVATALETEELGPALPTGGEAYVHPSMIALSPDGKKIAYALRRPGRRAVPVVDGKAGREYGGLSFFVFSPDNSQVAYAASVNPEQIWFVVRGGSTDPEFAATSVPVFSPDGSKLGYVAARNRAGKQFIVVNGKRATPEYDTVMSAFVFSPDGGKLAYGITDRGKSYLVVGEERSAPWAVAGNPVFNADGSKVAYAASADGSRFFVVVNARRGPEYAGDPPSDICFSPDGRKLAYVAVQNGGGGAGETHVVVLDVGTERGPVVQYDYGPLNVQVSSVQPLTQATVSAAAWSPVFSPDSARLAYGLNGGPEGAVTRPMRTAGTGRLYQIANALGSSTIVVDGKRAATVKVTGLVTPLSFSGDGKEISWMHLREGKLYLRRLKLR